MSADGLAVKSIEKYLPRNCPFRSYVGQRDTSTSCKLFSKVKQCQRKVNTSKQINSYLTRIRNTFYQTSMLECSLTTPRHTMLVAVASFYGKSGIVYCYQCKAMFGNFTCLVLGLTVIAGSLIYPKCGEP